MVGVYNHPPAAVHVRHPDVPLRHGYTAWRLASSNRTRIALTPGFALQPWVSQITPFPHDGFSLPSNLLQLFSHVVRSPPASRFSPRHP